MRIFEKPQRAIETNFGRERGCKADLNVKIQFKLYKCSKLHFYFCQSLNGHHHLFEIPRAMNKDVPIHLRNLQIE